MSAPSSHYVGLRLRALIWSCLDCDLLRSAVFFAERYYCLDPQNHQARHLYANALLRAEQLHSALNLVNDKTCLGCTEVFSRCCNTLGRYREGKAALEECLAQVDGAAALEASMFQETRQFPDAAVLACRLGLLAMKTGMPKDAIASFNRALTINPFMWEAIEGLCQLGSFPELNELVPPRGQYAKDLPIPRRNTAATSSHGSLFTPESSNNGISRPQVNGGKGLFRLKGNTFLGRESIGSVADSSFGEFNSPGVQPRQLTADMMLTAGANAVPRGPLTANDGRPQPKRARGEIPSATDPPAAGSRGTVNSKRASQRAPADVSTRELRRNPRPVATVKTTAQPKTRERKRGPISQAAKAAPLTSDGDEEMMPPDGPHITPFDVNDPLSWDATNPQIVERMAVEEADAYILELVRIFAKALQYLASYQCQNAIDELERLPIEQQQSPWVMTLTGRACYEKLDYSKAERCFQRARELDPYRLQDMEIYSTLLWHLQRETELSFLAQELVAMDNTSAVAWIAAGNCYSLEKEHQQALLCFRRATQLDPRSVYAYNLSGHECVAMDDHDKAIDFFRQALKVDARHYPAWYGLGMVYYRTNKADFAMWHFRKAIEINSSNAVLICCEGMVFEQKRMFEQALKVYTRAVHVAPSSSLVMFRRARMLVELELYDDAVPVLMRLKEIIPEEANIPFMLAQVYKKMGQSTEAAQYMAIALDVEPKIANAIRSTQQRGGRVILDGLASIPSAADQSMDTDAG